MKDDLQTIATGLRREQRRIMRSKELSKGDRLKAANAVGEAMSIVSSAKAASGMHESEGLRYVKLSEAREVNPASKKWTFDKFVKAYFGGENVPRNVAREFWDDFRYAHVGSLKSYIAATSG